MRKDNGLRRQNLMKRFCFLFLLFLLPVFSYANMGAIDRALGFILYCGESYSHNDGWSQFIHNHEVSDIKKVAEEYKMLVQKEYGLNDDEMVKFIAGAVAESVKIPLEIALMSKEERPHTKEIINQCRRMI